MKGAELGQKQVGDQAHRSFLKIGGGETCLCADASGLMGGEVEELRDCKRSMVQEQEGLSFLQNVLLQNIYNICHLSYFFILT